MNAFIRGAALSSLAIVLTAGASDAVRSAPGGDPGPSCTLNASPPDFGDGRTHVLFDGSAESWKKWVHRDGSPSRWDVLDDTVVRVKPGTGNSMTAEHFRDFQLHLEFMCPLMEDARGQGRGNSGVYLHGRYEVQILDSFGLDSKDNDCAGIYRVAPPDVNACRPPEDWQTYDIFFRAPRFDSEGNVTENPRITVLHNGVLVHDNLEIPGPTGAAMASDMLPDGPVLLQDHGNLVQFRNIWLREMQSE